VNHQQRKDIGEINPKDIKEILIDEGKQSRQVIDRIMLFINKLEKQTCLLPNYHYNQQE